MAQVSRSGRTTGSVGGPSGPSGLIGPAVIALAASCFFFGWQAVWAFCASAIDSIFSGTLTIAVSLVIGAWSSLSGGFLGDVGFEICRNPYALIAYPLLSSLIFGMLAGAVIAWLRTAIRAKEEYDTLTSAVFSAEPLRNGGIEFAELLIANIIAGYVVMFAFSLLQVIGTGYNVSPHLIDAATIMLGGAPPPGGDGGAFSAFFALLAALVLIGAIVGAVAGASFGSGVSLAVLGLHSEHIVFGAAQGSVVRWLMKKSDEKGVSAGLRRLAVGASTGAIEGALVGSISGALVTLGHLFE